ncbi:hypothetical protein KFE25_006399 [Diacronema lutheri]|uniref:Methyltransferase-like protein n=1 Tax=Diacronema lutheri TaxID=2081491 RepID=A0A8J6CER8_DIALT|nr:hypothetical protein KFE25_006399 [Diacronema lutheri]
MSPHRGACVAAAVLATAGAAVAAWAVQRWVRARWLGASATGGASAQPPPRGTRAEAAARERDARRAGAKDRRRARRAASREAQWRAASELAAVNPGVKKRERAFEPGADLSAHNAWDAVPWDTALEAQTVRDASAQPAAPDAAVRRVRAQSDAMWDAFYRTNLLAYKHRRYLHAEFPELAELGAARPGGAAGAAGAEGASALVLEIGCGPGNAALPLLAQFPALRVCASDISPQAVRLLATHPAFPPERCSACVWDVADASGALPAGVREGEADAALLVFALSALPPDAFARAARNVFRALMPGGVLLFRDYGVSDEKQRKFTRAGTKLGERWYARQNGTMVYFFDTAEVDALFAACGFEPVPPRADGSGGGGGSASFDKLLTVNRKTGARLWRVWVSARYRKPAERNF